MTTTQETFKQAMEHHRLGQVDDAEQDCRQILQRDPHNAHALHLLGLIAHERGQHIAAVDHLTQAVMAEPSEPSFHVGLASAQVALGHVEQATRSLREALRLSPERPKIHNDLGVLLAAGQQFDEAADCFRQVLRLAPNYGPAHNNLGNILSQQGKIDEAIACFRAALTVTPQLVQAYNNLANALNSQGQREEAVTYYREALQIAPNYAEGHYNLGLALQESGQFDDAVAHLQRAIELRPNEPIFQVNLGTVRMDQGLLTEAMACFDTALKNDPHFASARYFRGTVLLARGEFAEGWAEHEARLRCPGFKVRRFDQPQWTGEPLAGCTLLIHAEQGLGDTLQFIRYLKSASQWNGNTVVSVQPELLPLLTQSGFTGLIGRDQSLPDFDLQAALLSLPQIFRTDLSSIPVGVPYLAADPQRIERWRLELERYPGFKVGIAWQGRTTVRGDRLRSIPLSFFEPLAATGARLFSLQKGAGIEQLTELKDRFPIVDLAPTLDNQGGAFVDSAAVMKNLDLVITSDTAVAHLAGALGVPVWVALATAPDWRWLVDRDDSPWYPTMRLFRQHQWNNWSGVFARMAKELSNRIADKSRS